MRNNNKLLLRQKFGSRFKKTDAVQLIALLLLTMVIFSPITLTAIAFKDITDYPTYLENAEDISVNPKYWSDVASNPMWVMMVLAVRGLFSIQHWKAAYLVQMGNQGLLALVLFFLSRKVLPKSSFILPVVLPIGIMLAAPFFLLAVKDRQLYNGYLGINSYHNPTIFALKPYAVILYYYACEALKKSRIPVAETVLCLIVAIVSTLIKPSFIICLLPAAGIYFLINLWKKKPFDWKTMVFAIFLPSVLVLGYEYLSTYTSGDVGLAFYPLAVMKNSSNYLLAKFFLSVWFPLAVLLAYWKDGIRQISLQLAWLVFIFGAFYTYMLAESGWRIFHGNFTWSGEIGMFILFAASALYFFGLKNDTYPERKWRAVLIFGFLPHILSGMVYYGYFLLTNIYA